MRYKIQEKLYYFSIILEVIIAFVIIIAISISSFNLILYMKDSVSVNLDISIFREYLNIACDIVIGIEFVKMLCKHSMNSVVEVVLFALAREMIVEHTTQVENLVVVISIAILFLVRKYLFVSGLDIKDEKKDVFPKEGIHSVENMLHKLISKNKQGE